MSNPIEEFQNLTGTTPEVAKQYLDNNKQDLQVDLVNKMAVDAFFTQGSSSKTTAKITKEPKKNQTTYAGGGSSGLALMGRPEDDGNDDPSDIIQQILKKGKEFRLLTGALQ